MGLRAIPTVASGAALAAALAAIALTRRRRLREDHVDRPADERPAWPKKVWHLAQSGVLHDDARSVSCRSSASAHARAATTYPPDAPCSGMLSAVSSIESSAVCASSRSRASAVRAAHVDVAMHRAVRRLARRRRRQPTQVEALDGAPSFFDLAGGARRAVRPAAGRGRRP